MNAAMIVGAVRNWRVDVSGGSRWRLRLVDATKQSKPHLHMPREQSNNKK
jgi:hypothetical protein